MADTPKIPAKIHPPQVQPKHQPSAPRVGPTGITAPKQPAPQPKK